MVQFLKFKHYKIMKKNLEKFKNQMLTREQMKMVSGGSVPKSWTCTFIHPGDGSLFSQTYPNVTLALADCRRSPNCVGCGNDADN
jgi:hypothetical protein